MGSETDFQKLYQELGLAPGCDMRTLTLAYRRRIQELHPDRRPDSDDPAADERLRTLIALYGAAQHFHQRFGRLPGTASCTPAPRPVLVPEHVLADTPRARPARNWLAVWTLPIVIGLCWWYWDAAEPASAPEPGYVPNLSDAAQPTARELALGMDPDAVLAVQGRPPLDLGDRWEYGPSFVRFEHRKVVDWYSSPLRPLKTSNQRPPPPAPPPPTLR
jgi:hypothetical protein